jgi:predicted phosphodiesterase
MKTFVFATDLHGDHQNSEAVDALLRFTALFKPDVRIFGGDLFDFRAIRRGAGKAEQSDSMAADVEAGLYFLGKFKPHVFLRGNHDERLWDTARFSQSGLVTDAARAGIKDIESKVKRIKCKMLPYDSRIGVYKINALSFIHGFHAGIYATKKHAEVYAVPGGCVLHGHTHSIQAASIARLGNAEGRGVGCLADLNPEYNRHQTARLMHQHGFAYGVVGPKGWEVWQAKPDKEGRWHVAAQIKTL